MKKIYQLWVLVLVGFCLSLPIAASWQAPLTNRLEMVDPVSLVLRQDQVEVELDTSFDPRTLIVEGSYDEVLLPIVDTQKQGEQILTFKAQKGSTKITMSTTILVKPHDETPPVFIRSVSKIVSDHAEIVNFNQFFEAQDDIDGPVDITYSGNYDFNQSGTYQVEAIARDQSGNEERLTFELEVSLSAAELKAQEEAKAKRQAEVEKAKKEAAAVNQEEAKKLSPNQMDDAFYVRMTRYGMDCHGCQVRNGVAYTSSGIALTATSVGQPDGTFQAGITYNGRYIFGSSRNMPRCALITVYDHGYQGMGIDPDQPIYGVVADTGAVGDDHLDLFVGSETNLNVVSIVNRRARPYAIITGLGTYTGSGCQF